MNIYGDESGSITHANAVHNPYFVICLVKVNDASRLRRVMKRFIAANMEELRRLDVENGRMFRNGVFSELKGSSFDRPMKQKFAEYISRTPLFELFYVVADNSRLEDRFCVNTARTFNYLICKSLTFFRHQELLPDEDCILQLDERNEKTEAKHFLENYLNTQLTLDGTYSHAFRVQYFDSSRNQIIQLADVLSNLYFSHLLKNAYQQEVEMLEKRGILKGIFSFPRY